MITAWTQGLNEEDQGQLKKQIKNSKGVLDRIIEIMDRDENALNRRESTSSVYDSPNWDYRQADANGYRRCLREYKQLLTIDPDKE